MITGVKLSMALVTALLFFNGCAVNPKRPGIVGVEVAVYYEAGAAEAGPLTFELLHRQGIAAEGHGSGGWIHVVVSPDQADNARQLLETEWSGLSEANKSSFQIVDQSLVAGSKGLDFLKDVPSLAEVSLKMTEAEFLDIVHRQGFDCQWEIASGQRTYWVKPKPHVIVVFGFRAGQCTGIQRLQD